MSQDADPEELPEKAALGLLLAERNQNPDRVEAIDAAIRERFVRKVAVLVLDMCGFSRLTAQHGVIHFLAMIHQMESGATPAVRGNGGQVVKQEADNLFAVFPQPTQALEAALDILRAFEAMNAVVTEDRSIRASIGIGYGDVLVIGGKDLFGNEMNLACKLGEDIATAGEVLLTAAAHAALPPQRYACAAQHYELGGLSIEGYRYERCLYPRIARPLPPSG